MVNSNMSNNVDISDLDPLWQNFDWYVKRPCGIGFRRVLSSIR